MGNGRSGKALAAIAAVALAAVLACGNVRYGSQQWESDWKDEHTFRVRAVGALRGSGDAVHGEMRKSCEDAAVFMAGKIIIEKFAAARYERTRGPKEYDAVRRLVSNEFSAVIQNGRVVESRPEGGGVCSIVFEIHDTGLKKKVLAAR